MYPFRLYCNSLKKEYFLGGIGSIGQLKVSVGISEDLRGCEYLLQGFFVCAEMSVRFWSIDKVSTADLC